MELTLKEYADSLNLSYESVRQSFKLHAAHGDLLEGDHFRKAGRSRILTDAGIAVMNSYRQKAVAILPNDTAAMQKQVDEAKAAAAAAEEEAAALKAENANLRLQIADLTNRLQERSDALITALYHVQNLQERLLPAAEEPKRGIFSRIFRKKVKE